MNLHSVLTNLTDYVDMGVAYYLKKDARDYGTLNDEMNRLTDWFYSKDIVRWLDNMDDDVKDFVTENYSLTDLLDGYDYSDVMEYVGDNMDIRDVIGYYDNDDVLEEFDIDDIRNYLLYHYNVDDILEGFDSSKVRAWLRKDEDDDPYEILRNMDISELREYLSENRDIDDFVRTEWRCY